MAKKIKTEDVPVLVMSEVCGGRLHVAGGITEHYDPYENTPQSLVLIEARTCLHWPREERGFMGLASHGPSREARVSRAVPIMRIDNVQAVVLMTPEALEAWRKEPWPGGHD